MHRFPQVGHENEMKTQCHMMKFQDEFKTRSTGRGKRSFSFQSCLGAICVYLRVGSPREARESVLRYCRYSDACGLTAVGGTTSELRVVEEPRTCDVSRLSKAHLEI